MVGALVVEVLPQVLRVAGWKLLTTTGTGYSGQRGPRSGAPLGPSPLRVVFVVDVLCFEAGLVNNSIQFC